MKLATEGHIVSPPNIVYVTALPCEILLSTLLICLPLVITNTKILVLWTWFVLKENSSHVIFRGDNGAKILELPVTNTIVAPIWSRSSA